MKRFLALVLLCLASAFCHAQYLNNKWLWGEFGTPPLPFGGSKMEFSNNTRTISYNT